MFKKLILLLLFFSFQKLNAENRDSLWKVYKDPKIADTSRLMALNEMLWMYTKENPDTGMVLAKEMLSFAKKARSKRCLAKAYHNMGLAYYWLNNFKESIHHYKIALALNRSLNSKDAIHRNFRGIADAYFYAFDYKNSLDYYNKALVVSQELNDKHWECYYITNIADVYQVIPDYPKALKYYLMAVKMAEELKDETQIATCYSGLSNVYDAQSNYNKSLEYLLKMLAINQRIGSQIDIAGSLVQVASAYYFKKDYTKAREFYEKALKIYEEIKREGGIGSCYIGLANVYSDQINYPKALEYYLMSVKIKEKEGAGEGMVISYINTGDMYYVLGDYKRALDYCKKGLDSAQKLKQLFYLTHAYRSVAKSHAKLGNYKEAYDHYVIHKRLNDSIYNQENSKQLGDMRVKFEVDKRENELTIKAVAEQDKIKAIAKEEKKIQYIIIFSVAGILLLVVVFSIFLYNRFRITKRQKHIIELKSKETEFQKLLVEEKQKEIIDSITYAKRLQHAILPPKEYVDRYLQDNFFIYKPKDIIAGDFYWMHVSGNEDEKVLIAAADSTGHGVPGAMVSIVCSNALDKAVKEFGLTDPGQILDKTTDLVLETFAKSGEDIKDGMDISLLSIEKISQDEIKLKWSGANNSLWYIEPTEITIKEIKANKQPVGKSDHRKPFLTHEIEYKAGTIFYLMTDGFADQFGGPKGKKFKYKQLENIIISNFHKPLSEQRDIITREFDVWKGDLDQVDDVTLIAIRL